MSDKPKPIHRTGPKSLGWVRGKTTGFILPRLNEPTGKTEAVGFIDYREYEWDGGAYARKTHDR